MDGILVYMGYSPYIQHGGVMSDETKNHKFRETCLKIIEKQGNCSSFQCQDCPFYEDNHLNNSPFSCNEDRDLLSPDLLMPACHEWLFHDPCINFVIYAIQVQGEVLEECCHCDMQKEMEFVLKYAGLMRKILNEWALEYDRLISKDDLIWICSEKARHNIRED